MNNSVLIIDDELGIRKSLEGIFQDEGFTVTLAANGKEALTELEAGTPSVILLDIWMPGMDGIELLKLIKARYSDLPVIMISGHATIATAIEATRLGAADFIEKPLDLETVLQAVRRVLTHEGAESTHIEIGVVDGSGGIGGEAKARTLPSINPVVFREQKCRGKKVTQHTIANSALLYGQGLHSGKKSGLTIEPLPANSGIHFLGVSDNVAVPAHLDYVQSTGFATTIKVGKTQAGTIKHLMSALAAYRISNLLIKCNGEVPVMDGSATEFCALLEEIGIVDQEGDWYDIKIEKVIKVGDTREWIQVEPADDFSIDYTLSYPAPVGVQKMTFTVDDVESYKKEISRARTFGFIRDIGALQKQGLALGGRFDNFVLIGESGPLNTTLRYQDEFVRHKILDAVGDLYLLGRRIQGKITASMTGHSDNIELLRKIAVEIGNSSH